MRTLGLIGGVTWHSTTTYYRRLNEEVVRRCGPGRSADLLLRSLDYGAVTAARAGGDWRPLGALLVRSARALRGAGAEALLLASNSLHGQAHRIEAEGGLPLLHIGDALADAAVQAGHRRLALFGTGFTMRQRFLRDRLEARGLQVLVPDGWQRIDAIVQRELTRGLATDASRAVFLRELDALVARGADAMVLGCTEIPMLIGPADTDVPLLDTLELHAQRAAAWMVGGDGDGDTAWDRGPPTG